jgi:hypothetical protein
MDNEIKATEESTPTPSPFAPERLALRGDPGEPPGSISVRRALVKVPVRKPDEIEAWFSSKLGGADNE